MGSRILFVAGPSDLDELKDYIQSLGLYLVPPMVDQEYNRDSGKLAGCFISPVPADQLKSSGGSRWDVLDPILSFSWSVYMPPYLTPGNVYWNNDVVDLARQTKPTFQKIARWVRKHWAKPQGNDWHYGPEAWRLRFEEGVTVTSMLPGVQLIRVPVHSIE